MAPLAASVPPSETVSPLMVSAPSTVTVSLAAIRALLPESAVNGNGVARRDQGVIADAGEHRPVAADQFPSATEI